MVARPLLYTIQSNFEFRQHVKKAFTCNEKVISFVPAPLLVGVELNPGPPKGTHLSEKDRWRCVFLSEENNLGPVEIARKLKTTKKTVRKV